MSGAELPLAIVGVVATVDVAVKYGTRLINICDTFRHAETEVSERVLRIQSRWYRTKSQLDFLSRVWSALDQEHQQLQDQLLTVLTSKLSAAESKICSLIKGQRTLPDDVSSTSTSSMQAGTRKMKYTMMKKTLDHTIEDLKNWQDEFDPSWYLILKVGGHTIDQGIRDTIQQPDTLIKNASSIRDTLKENPRKSISVLLPSDQLEDASFEMIPLSSARLMQRTGSSTWLILDSVPCDSSMEFNHRMKTIRDLAKKLTKTEPSTFSLLNCIGFVAEKSSSKFELVFRIPPDMSKPQSLRSSLVEGDRHHSLSDRFQIALQLARGVCSVHTFGLVHKSIRPENILLFADQNSTLGSAFLVGFENVRLEEGRTRLRSDADWEKNLYRHPQRQGVQVQDPYIMQHDIYSLGVCLLEIGLWRSFVSYTGSLPDPTKSRGYSFYEDEEHDSEKVKQHLLALTKDRLRREMGNNYSRIVETCLRCLDEGNEGFGNESEFQDEDGVLVAIRYIETILLQLSSISV